MKPYIQKILYGRSKRPGILETVLMVDKTTFKIKDKNGNVIATRTTSKNSDEEATITRLSKAVNGLFYVFIIPVLQGKADSIKEKYFKINN